MKITVVARSERCQLTSRPRNAALIPFGMNDFITARLWVVLRRIVTGSATASPDAPFKVEGFDGLTEGVGKYFITDHALKPILLTAPDGKILVIARTSPEKPRSRAVGH